MFRRSDAELLDEFAITSRVLPNDLDLNGHMNNGRYLTIMDLGRIGLMVRLGLLTQVLRRRWRPVIGSATIYFKRPLGPFERYELITRVIGWDDKWFFLDQRFRSQGKLAAYGIVKAAFRTSMETIPPAVVLASIHVTTSSPPTPKAIETWLLAETFIADGK